MKVGEGRRGLACCITLGSPKDVSHTWHPRVPLCSLWGCLTPTCRGSWAVWKHPAVFPIQGPLCEPFFPSPPAFTLTATRILEMLWKHHFTESSHPAEPSVKRCLDVFSFVGEFFYLFVFLIFDKERNLPSESKQQCFPMHNCIEDHLHFLWNVEKLLLKFKGTQAFITVTFL